MATQLLLTQDVDALGRAGDLVKVRPGYARNYLLPQGYALVANKQALRKQKRLQEERQIRAVEDKKEAEKLAEQLTAMNATVSTVVKVDHEGHMYGSVTVLDIVHLVKDQLKIELEKRSIQLKHPIKEIGVHEIALKLKEGIPAKLTVKIEADTENPQA